MQIINVARGARRWDREKVTASVTIGVVSRVPGHAMQRLMHVTEIVDQQAEVEASRHERVNRLDVLNGPVDSTDGVHNRVVHLLDGPRHVEGLVVDFSGVSLVEEGLIGVVPDGKALPTGILYEISKGS